MKKQVIEWGKCQARKTEKGASLGDVVCFYRSGKKDSTKNLGKYLTKYFSEGRSLND